MRSPSAANLSYSDGVSIVIASNPATIVTGLALKVPPCATRVPSLVGSKTAMTSARPPNAPTGNPPPMILPNVVMSAA